MAVAQYAGATDDCQLPHGRTKKLSDALLHIARRGTTSHPILSNLFVAREFNQLCGTTIGPWDVEQLPDVWIDAVTAVTHGLKELQAGLDQVKQVQDKIRASYLSGRKHA